MIGTITEFMYSVYIVIMYVCAGRPREEKWAAEYISEVDDKAMQW